MTTPSPRTTSSKAKRISPELAELVSMLSALEQRNETQQTAPAKS